MECVLDLVGKGRFGVFAAGEKVIAKGVKGFATGASGQ